MKNRIKDLFILSTIGLSVVLGGFLAFDWLTDFNNERLRLATISMETQSDILKVVESGYIKKITGQAEDYVNPTNARFLLASNATKKEGQDIRFAFDRAILQPTNAENYVSLDRQVNLFIDSLKARNEDYGRYSQDKYCCNQGSEIFSILHKRNGLDCTTTLKRTKLDVWVLELRNLNHFHRRVSGTGCWGILRDPVVSFSTNKFKQGKPFPYTIHLSEYFRVQSEIYTVNGQPQKSKDGKVTYAMRLKPGRNPIDIQVVCTHKDSTTHLCSLVYDVYADD